MCTVTGLYYSALLGCITVRYFQERIVTGGRITVRIPFLRITVRVAPYSPSLADTHPGCVALLAVLPSVCLRDHRPSTRQEDRARTIQSLDVEAEGY